MKYIFKNISSYIKTDIGMFILSAVAIMISAFIINFSYGVYQHYHIELEEMVAGSEYIAINFNNTSSKYVSKEMLDTCIQEMIDYQDNLSNYLGNILVEASINNTPVDCNFMLGKYSIQLADVLADNIERNKLITEGHYWSSVNEEEGSRVALCTDCRGNDDMYSSAINSMVQDDGTMLIGGRTYTIVGYQVWSQRYAMIPYQSMEPQDRMCSMVISYNESVNAMTYKWIKEMFERNLGELVTVEEQYGKDQDTYYTYRTVIVVVILLTIIATINYSILYMYIMTKRRKNTRVYRMCGMPLWKVNLINIAECLMVSVPFYILSAVIYHFLCLPKLSRYYLYMRNAYTLVIYLVMFFIYLVTSCIICSFMIVRKNRTIMEEFC